MPRRKQYYTRTSDHPVESQPKKPVIKSREYFLVRDKTRMIVETLSSTSPRLRQEILMNVIRHFNGEKPIET